MAENPPQVSVRQGSPDAGVARHGGFRLNDTRNIETAKHVPRSNIAYYRRLGLSRVEMYAGPRRPSEFGSRLRRIRRTPE